MNEFVLILLSLFGSIGLVQCIAWVADLCRKPSPPRGYHVIPLYDGPAGIEAQLRQDLARLRWWGDNGRIVLLVDMGLGEESLAVCDRFLRQNPGLICCRPGRLDEALRDLEQLQRD